MSDELIVNQINAIHDQTMAMLRALHIPPYPSHYKKYFDEIFMQQADEALMKDLQANQRAEKDNCGSCKYLEIAQRSVNSFVETHSDISHIANMQDDYLKTASEHNGEQCIELVDGLTRLSGDMSDELKKAEFKIDQLSADLEKAMVEAVTDPLTQITNRKGFIDDLESIVNVGESKQLSAVLIMIDADNFKALNDTYGHVAGDKVLYFMAQSIKSIIRTGDKVYRYGGEEFAVILNRCEQEQAFAIADKIRAKIEHSNLIYSGKTIQMTVSVGVTIHHLKDNSDDFVARADKALYRAKQEGKNKTVLFD